MQAVRGERISTMKCPTNTVTEDLVAKLGGPRVPFDFKLDETATSEYNVWARRLFVEHVRFRIVEGDFKAHQLPKDASDRTVIENQVKTHMKTLVDAHRRDREHAGRTLNFLEDKRAIKRHKSRRYQVRTTSYLTSANSLVQKFLVRRRIACQDADFDRYAPLLDLAGPGMQSDEESDDESTTKSLKIKELTWRHPSLTYLLHFLDTLDQCGLTSTYLQTKKKRGAQLRRTRTKESSRSEVQGKHPVEFYTQEFLAKVKTDGFERQFQPIPLPAEGRLSLPTLEYYNTRAHSGTFSGVHTAWIEHKSQCAVCSGSQPVLDLSTSFST